MFKKVFVYSYLFFLCAHCGQAQNETSPAAEVFEEFWQLFNESYASFEEKGIDWQATYDTYRPKITPSTSEPELFQILSDALKPLGDEHVNLRAKKLEKRFSAGRPSRILDVLESYDNGKERGKKIRAMIDHTLSQKGFDELKEAGPVWRNLPLFTYGHNEKIAYLRFTRCFGKNPGAVGNPSKILEEIFEDIGEVEAFIIDVRFNIGGDDAFSQAVAGRFIQKKQVSYYKQTRKKGIFGELKSRYIKPTTDKPFLKPVVVLSNDQTISAADVFMLIMSQLENVTLVGEPCNGSFSDLYYKKLSNGWEVTLSNQRYLSLDKQNYEGKGIPVDLEVKNTQEDFEQQEDSVLLKALEVLEDKIEKP